MQFQFFTVIPKYLNMTHFEEFISYHAMILPSILVTRHKHTHNFLIELLCFLCFFFFAQYINITSMYQELVCYIHFPSFLIFLGHPSKGKFKSTGDKVFSLLQPIVNRACIRQVFACANFIVVFV